MTLEELQSFQINKEQRNKLQAMKEWGLLKDVVEEYVLKLTANLLTGSEIYENSSTDALKELRGFVRYWKKISNMIDNKQEETNQK